MFFRKLELLGFPPFADQEIEFPENSFSMPLAETHILTGINGTGKTRFLSVLAAALGNDEHIIKRWPVYGEKDSIFIHNINANLLKKVCVQVSKCPIYVQIAHDENDFATTLGFAYNGTAYIEDSAIKPMVPTKIPGPEERLSFRRSSEMFSQTLLQNIANLIFQAAMDIKSDISHGEPDKDWSKNSLPYKIIHTIETIILEITGKQFDFKVTAYPKSEIMANWGDLKMGSFSLLPDGLRAIIGWLAHAVVMLDACLEGKSDPTDYPAIFLIDEPETHLHPAWQRQIIPAFQKLFPKAQIFVATHSPFVISSINHGWIHRLVYDENGKVKVKTQSAELGDSYMSVAEDLMGIEPIMAFDPETEKMLKDFYAERENAYKRVPEAIEEAEKIAIEISKRGSLLNLMMGNEMAQMRRQLAKPKTEG